MSDRNQDDVLLKEQEKINFGEQLKASREQLGLSIQEAAARLHLSPRFISMLENENLLQVKLPLIYLKGYLRSYAQLLSIPEGELAQVLEKLTPAPVILEPAPLPSDSLSLPFPLEKQPYYIRLVTFFISLALLTSITAWWYLHGSANTATVVALKEPTEQEAGVQAIEGPSSSSGTVNKETIISLNNTTQEAADKHGALEQNKTAASSVNLAAQTSLTLASNSTDQNTTKPAVKPTHPHEESEDDSPDEQE